jgi:hypothetical protein
MGALPVSRVVLYNQAARLIDNRECYIMPIRRLLCLIAVIVIAAPALVMRAQAPATVQVTLKATPLGSANGFASASATALVDKAGGWLTFTLKLPEGYTTPEKTVFEGWITDGSALTSPLNSAADLDQKYGPRYGSRTIASMFDAVPYWLSAGALVDDGKGNLTTAMKWPNYNLRPYDMVAITIETDGNETPWDPRPGSMILSGQIADGTSADEIDIDQAMGEMPDLGVAQGVSLRLTKLAESAGLKGATGKALVLIESAAAQLEVRLPAGAKVPEGAVLEGWVVDGGKLTFGPSHAHADDNKLGPAFNNAYLSAIADAIPFSTSLGVLKPDDKGIYRLQIHWKKYAFRVYDLVVVTIEADGDVPPWNPRPGTPGLIGAINPDTNIVPMLAMPPAEDMAPLSDMGRLVPPAATAAATAAATPAK